MTPSLVLALALSLCSISAKADFNVFRPLSLSQLLAPVEGSEKKPKNFDPCVRMTIYSAGWTTRAAAQTPWWACSQRCRPGCRGPWRSLTTGTWSAPSGLTGPFSGESRGAYQGWNTCTCLHLKGSSWNSRESWEGSRIVSRLVTELEQKSHNLYKQQEHRGESLFLQNK